MERVLMRMAVVAAMMTAASVAAKPLEYICYSPYRDGQAPGVAEPTEAQIREDFKILAPFVKGIRTYSAVGVHGQIPKLALEAGLEVYAGAWIGKDDGANLDQVNKLIAMAKTGNASIKGLIVGNEVLLRQDVTKSRLIEYIKMVRNANTGIPVTTADIYQRIGDNAADLNPVVDYAMAHVHPFWEDQAADKGAQHVLKGWNGVKAKYPGKQVIIGETGFPSAGQTRGGAIPSEAAQTRFTVDLVKLAAANGMTFMLFSSFDEAWKGAEGPVGANWGIWKTNRLEKPAVAQVRALPVAITLPGRGAHMARGIASGTVLRVDANGRLRALAGMPVSAGSGARSAGEAAFPVWTGAR